MPPSRRSSRISNGSVTPTVQYRKRNLLDALESKSRKKTKTSPLDPYLKISRWIARSEDPFTNFYSVFHAGMKDEGFQLERDEEEEEHDPIAPLDETRHQHFLRIYKLISSTISSFKLRIEEFSDKPEGLEELCKQMTSAIGGARSDDCGSLKEVGLTYAALEVGTNSLTPSIAPKATKAATRGFHHPVLGRLLCPAKHLVEFDEDSVEFLKKLEDGRVTVMAHDLPTFLYENSTYDPTDMEKGLCRSDILLRTYRHIFTSPSSAMKSTPGAGRTKSGQAKLNGLESVTPRTIAYAALHVRWFMCSEDDWRVDDGLFNKEEFFNVLVQLFESDPDDEWCKDTLAWWNFKVFTATKSANSTNPIGHSTPSDLTTLLAQRRARKAREDGSTSQSANANSNPSTNDTSRGSPQASTSTTPNLNGSTNNAITAITGTRNDTVVPGANSDLNAGARIPRAETPGSGSDAPAAAPTTRRKRRRH